MHSSRGNEGEWRLNGKAKPPPAILFEPLKAAATLYAHCEREVIVAEEGIGWEAPKIVFAGESCRGPLRLENQAFVREIWRGSYSFCAYAGVYVCCRSDVR